MASKSVLNRLLLIVWVGAALAVVPPGSAAEVGSDSFERPISEVVRAIPQPLIGPPARPFVIRHDVDLPKVSKDDYYLVDLCVEAAMARGGTPGGGGSSHDRWDSGSRAGLWGQETRW